MAGWSLAEKWKEKHTETFLLLKAKLTTEPVLKGPRWDGSPFILTTDGCKDAFGAMLTQRSETVLPNGSTVKRIH
ncbi:hypothetical protein BDN72DRAFT_828715, partial [Pluteus cervinus]